MTSLAQFGTSACTVSAGINIALIKYWGKAPAGVGVAPDGNLPAVGSLSLTLDAPGTVTTVTFDHEAAADSFVLDGAVGDVVPIARLLDGVRARAGLSAFARVVSRNTVPTAAGLASSASGFAALGLAGWRAAGLPSPDDAPPVELVDLVRRGSGSAPRSLLSNFARIDRETGRVHAVPASDALELSLVIALCAEGPKETLSRDGMRRSAETSPYYAAWVDTHEADLDVARAAVSAGDFVALGLAMEHSTMKMHACMLASRPPLRYWAPATLAALDALAALRRVERVFTTMDAGPHVKALCRRADEAEVAEALRGVAREVLIARPGPGARVVAPTPPLMVASAGPA